MASYELILQRSPFASQSPVLSALTRATGKSSCYSTTAEVAAEWNAASANSAFHEFENNPLMLRPSQSHFSKADDSQEEKSAWSTVQGCIECAEAVRLGRLELWTATQFANQSSHVFAKSASNRRHLLVLPALI